MTYAIAPPLTLSDLCRCTHARRFHRTSDGGVTVACQGWHTDIPEYAGMGCYFFERDERYVVFRRDERGRLHSLTAEAVPA